MNYEESDKPEPTHFAKLDDGRIVSYDEAMSISWAKEHNIIPEKHATDRLIYIGSGVFHSVDGVVQSCKTRDYFFIRR